MKILLLLAGSFILFAAGLGAGTLWDQDEAKYAHIARQIVQTGDPLTMHYNGGTWFVHPPLYLWLVAATGRLFGFTEFTARIWSAIFGMIGIYATYLLGRLFFTTRAAVLGAVVLMTMLEYFVMSRLAIFDVPLVAFMLLATYMFMRGIQEDRGSHFVWASLWAGLGTLTKGPIALILPAMALVVFFGLRRRPFPWRRIPWIAAGAIYLLVGLSWYLVQWRIHGRGFMATAVGYYLLNRFFGVVESQSGPWWYYAPVFGIGAIPWTAFLVAMVPYLSRRWKEHDGSLFVLVWCAVTVGFYTMAGTKLPNYVLPVYPLAALGIGSLWDRFLSGEPRAGAYVRLAFAGTVLALLIGAWEVTTFAQIKYPEQWATLQRHLFALAAGMLALFAVAVVVYVLRRPVAAFAGLAAVTVTLAAVVVTATLPLVEAHRPVKRVAAIVAAELRPGEPLVAAGISDQQTLLYYADRRVIWLNSPYELLTIVCYQRRALIVTRPSMVKSWIPHLREYGAVLEVTPVAEIGDLAVVRKDSDTPCRQPLIGR
ncbi:MAG: glycosyltransferase family 39 protein [Armatimonadetes bacterium]|nr:glycosyltransferase family 39 protein [Armatimonadota bacterium]